ncbi:hypothetical protein AC578_5997 [Pseudocercospora eumusae]|uniref:Uncharacterized protein n=1 Tax=Pseudocercospora eumusae TaxID=321146 RepID=A0A139HVF4_9PEZI|nr:hypothetical protein AC578_5997 [Pseudocercospora eumusae]
MWSSTWPWLNVFFLSLAAAETTISSRNFRGILNGDSGVLQSLRPTSEDSFDFSPSDYFPLRNGVGNYHTGDLTARWRLEGEAEWQDIDTAKKRNIKPNSTADAHVLLHTTFDDVFPDAAKHFTLSRDWSIEDDDLVLKATIQVKDSSKIELGAFGFPIEFNNIFTNRTAENTTAKCVLLDPYIGLDAGYVQVTRLTGTGPNLIVTPYSKDSRFEAWRFLDEDEDQPTYYQSQTFEGIYSWQTLTKAYKEREWNASDPWNEPTSVMLAPGKSISFALRFGLSNTTHDIEEAVASKGIPVAIGLPGYILPTDMDGQLYVNSKAAVSSIEVAPPTALTISEQLPKNTWKSYKVNSNKDAFGRVRVTIKYDDGRAQTVHYFVTDTQENSSEKLASFLFDKQWFNDTSDPFHRAPSVISYDYDAGKQVLQDDRAWIAGVSDEGGAGSFEAAAMKVAVRPTRDQVYKLETMVNTTVWGWLQDKTSDNSTNPPTYEYGVKRSLFYYEPNALPDFKYDPSIDWKTWTAWNKSDAYAVWRAYDYVHVSVIYWALYNADQVAPGILTVNNATWYLTQAYHTIMAAQADIVAYADAGLMGETVWLLILEALWAESLTSEADKLEAAMKERHDLWANQSEPFGSEMAWDSTGQEGVYLWSKYFNDSKTVEKTLSSIRGYMPTVAHWGWNGNARRYWDFLYAGKLQRTERMIHHYGSGLNSLPLLDSYKYNKDPAGKAAFHDLRVGYGGHMGPLSNINKEGFGAMAFHSFPQTLKWDAYSGDYGPNFLGHILGACTILVNHPDFGWTAFGGNIRHTGYGDAITVEPKDSVRRRLYIAAMGLKLEIEAGAIESFTYTPSTKSLKVKLEQKDANGAKTTNFKVEDTLGMGIDLDTDKVRLQTRRLTPRAPHLKKRRNGFEVALPAEVELSA